MLREVQGSFEGAIEQLKDEKVVPVSEHVSVEFSGDQVLLGLQDDTYTLEKHMVGQLFNKFGVSSKFVEGLEGDDPELQTKLLDLCFKRKPNLRFLANGAKDIIRLTNDKPMVTHRDLLIELEKEIKGKSRLWMGHDEKGHFEVRVVTPEISTSPKRDTNDKTHGGIVISSNGGIKLGAYLWRLVCSNGLRGWTRKMYAAGGATPESVLRQIHNRVPFLLKEIEDSIFAAYAASAEVRISNPRRTLTHFASYVSLPQSVREEILRRIPSEGVTLYDIINGMTELARDTENETMVFQDRLQTVASALMTSNGLKQCETCGSVLS